MGNPMFRASDTFSQSIMDAENLLGHFDKLNTKPPPPELEVLKRAGLVMAMTAWGDVCRGQGTGGCKRATSRSSDSSISAFVQSRLDEDIRRLHNPTSDKTIQLFRDYTGVDLTDRWFWNNFEKKEVRDRLNQYIKLRGDVVHRSRTIEPGPTKAHPVTKEDLRRVIRFERTSYWQPRRHCFRKLRSHNIRNRG